MADLHPGGHRVGPPTVSLYSWALHVLGIYELLMHTIFYFIFLDLIWPWVTETGKGLCRVTFHSFVAREHYFSSQLMLLQYLILVDWPLPETTCIQSHYLLPPRDHGGFANDSSSSTSLIALLGDEKGSHVAQAHLGISTILLLWPECEPHACPMNSFVKHFSSNF